MMTGNGRLRNVVVAQETTRAALMEFWLERGDDDDDVIVFLRQ